MSEYELIVYGDDDATPLFAAGTAAAHANPFLRVPTDFGEAEVDLREGRAMIGQLNVQVIDPQTGASQAERWLTARLGTAGGYSALNGRRALFQQVSPATVVVLDGVVGGVKLNDSFAGFELSVRDIRERGRKVKMFAEGGTTSLFPRGVVSGYGQLANGEYLAPPTRPLVGTFKRWGAAADQPYGEIQLEAYTKDGINPATIAWTRTLEQAMPGTRWDPDAEKLILPDVEVWWRAANSGAGWTKLRDMPAASSLNGVNYPAEDPLLFPGGGMLSLRRDRTIQAASETIKGTVVSEVWLHETASASVPANNQLVEFVVVYVGAPSEAFPLHWEGTAGELLRNVYRGDYSAEPPRIRYDESVFVGPDALPVMNTPVRLRITEPVDDLREWTEGVYKALRSAPALDALGRISPIDSRLPDVDADLLQIDDTNAVPIAGWDHPISGAVTVVRVTYERDYRIPPEMDPDGQTVAGDGLTSESVVVERRAEQAIIDVVGEKELEIDGFLFRALGGSEGQPISGDVADEVGYQHAQEAGDATIQRFAYGAPTSFVRVMRSDTEGVRVGDWVLDARSWRPNYLSGERGGNHLAQIVAVRDLNQAWRELRLVDAVPADQPLEQPTIGAPTADADGVVSVPILSIPSGAEARLDYAVSEGVPPTNSAAWVFLGRAASTGTLRSAPLPAGGTAWVRARSEAVGRRSSAWTTPVSVQLPETPRVKWAFLSINEEGVPTVTWETNNYANGVRLHIQVQDADGATLSAETRDYRASVGEAVLSGLVVAEGFFLVVDVEPWTLWTGSEVGGEAGTKVRAGQRSGPPGVTPLVILPNFREIGRTDTHITYGWDTPPPAVAEVWIYDMLYTAPEPSDPWDTERAPDVELIVGTDANQYTTTLPAEGEVKYLQFEPRTVALEAGEIRRAVVHGPASVRPVIAWVRQSPGSEAGKLNLRASIIDEVGRAGVLRVWVNPDSTATPDPTDPPDGSISLSAPRVVNWEDQFILTAGGNGYLFANVPVHAANGKKIYLEYVASDGTSSGVVDKDLLSYTQIIDEATGGLLNEVVKQGSIQQRAVGTLQLAIAGVERENIINKAVNAALMDDNILDLTEFSRVVANNAIVPGKLAVNELSEIADGAGIIVSGELRNAAGTRYINLDAVSGGAGSDGVFIAHEKFTLYANGDAAFGGLLTAETVMTPKLIISNWLGDDVIDDARLIVNGIITAVKLEIAEISEISDDLGILVSGRLEGKNGAYLDLDANSSATYFIYHPKFWLRGDGSAEFSGVLSAATGIFRGLVELRSGGNSEISFQTSTGSEFATLIANATGGGIIQFLFNGGGFFHIEDDLVATGGLMQASGRRVVTAVRSASRPSSPHDGLLWVS